MAVAHNDHYQSYHPLHLPSFILSTEGALEVNANYPTISILSGEKKVYATQKSSWSKKNSQAFLQVRAWCLDIAMSLQYTT